MLGQTRSTIGLSFPARAVPGRCPLMDGRVTPRENICGLFQVPEIFEPSRSRVDGIHSKWYRYIICIEVI